MSSMSRRMSKEKCWAFCALLIYLYFARSCHSVSLTKRGDVFDKANLGGDPEEGRWSLGQRLKPNSNEGRSGNVAPDPSDYERASLLINVSARGHRDFALVNSSWTVGESWRRGTSGPDRPHEYQAVRADFAKWFAMRPLVLCDDNAMTFTASGEGSAYLFVNREGSQPISLFQLPSYCGYSVKASGQGLEVIAPYGACYMIQKNGSHILPLLWLGSPMKLSCRVQPATPVPSVFCSSSAVAVQMTEQEPNRPKLRVLVKGAWRPFVSAACAHSVPSNPGFFVFLIPHNAPCITTGDGLYLYFLLDDQDYVLSCPASSQFSLVQDPADPSTSTSQVTQFPVYPMDPDSGSQVHQLPQLFPPGQLTQASQQRFPRHQTRLQQALDLRGSAANEQTESAADYQGSQHFPALDHPQVNMHPPFVLPPSLDYPAQAGNMYQGIPLYLQGPYSSSYLTPQTQSPSLPHQTEMSMPNLPNSPSYYFGYFYPQRPIFLPRSPLPPPAHATEQPHTGLKQAIGPPNCPSYPHMMCGVYPYPHFPIYSQYYPAQSQYPSTPQYTATQPPETTKKPFTSTTTPPTTTPTMTTATDEPSVQTFPKVQCVQGTMEALLPFADLYSFQIRDKTGSWHLLSGVSSLCGYDLQVGKDGMNFTSPLPACHSELQGHSSPSIALMFWDLSLKQYRTFNLQCPGSQNGPETPEPVIPTPSQTPPNTTSSDGHQEPVVPTPTVFCSLHQMDVELPTGPISEVVLKDLKGNQIKIHDAPKHCGYSARKGNNGKIHLTLQLHSHCHLSVQGKMYIITVVYMTQSGRREAQASCPVHIPELEQECNLPSNHRLPCGQGFVPEAQCRSMGCCFSPHACYYPMDACTADRHFVFSVPASLTYPPLVPSLLSTPGNITCKPQRVDSEYALFKIPMDECGTHKVMVGKTLVYIVEIVNKVQALDLYGIITREFPVRLFVECRYTPGSAGVSYMVKTPTLGPALHNQGVFGVQLRIAKDSQYKSYYPQYHQPMDMLLGKPLYLEVRLLNNPDPDLVLLVHFCVAYPRSGKSMWLILYNGCPNPLDPAPEQAVILDPQLPAQTRRFTISTFQFLPEGQLRVPNEEMYFMCSTEVCLQRDRPCVEGCFGRSRWNAEDY